MDVKTVDAGLLQSRYRLTKQRMAVLKAMGDGAHLSAETILDRVRSQLPGVSLGTIYRTLDILRELGLVQMFSFAGQAARYEAALDKHHHLLCTQCNSLVNVQADGLEEIARHVAEEMGYKDPECTFTIAGRCRRCAQDRASSAG